MSRTSAPRSPSGNGHFASIPSIQHPRSAFNRSHGHKTTLDASFLYPVFVDEALPGDTINLRMNSFIRMATPLKAPMDNLYVDSFFFSVPLRLLWQNFKAFMGENTPEPDSTTDYLMPYVEAPVGGFDRGSIFDYMGIPPAIAGLQVNAMFLRAYNLVYQEWFRDENLCAGVPVSILDGPDDPAWYNLKRRGKRHDYFTSALPWAQKGPSVPLPLGGQAPLVGDLQVLPDGPAFVSPTFKYVGGSSVPLRIEGGSGAAPSQALWGTAHAAAEESMYWADPNLHVDLSDVSAYADLSDATAATINTIRTAFQIQKMYERDARGGTRYTEIIRSHFGVTSPDARLQRPEYLGGGSSIMNVHPVAQTSGTDTQPTPQGNITSFVTGSAESHGFSQSFTEHCVVLGLVSIRADLTYQQGLNRMWSRESRFDYYWSTFSHLGEQEILQKEIYATGVPAEDSITFGFQERYAEYRYKPSIITGKFRSSDPQSLDIWHLAQDFPSAPVLNQTFIEEDVPVDRIIAVPSEPQFLADFWFSQKHVRPMPTYSVPGLVDHF